MTGFECPRTENPCGYLHTKCSAHSKRTGKPCGGEPMRGTEDKPRCRHHLGQRSEVVVARHRAQQQAVQLLHQQQDAARRHGADDLLDPLQALHVLSGEIWDWKEACRALVGQLDQLRYRSSSGEQLRAEIVLYERAQERAAKILADLVRLGIEERLERVESRQLASIGKAIESALTELADLFGFDPDDARIRPVISKHLREVER